MTGREHVLGPHWEVCCVCKIVEGDAYAASHRIKKQVIQAMIIT
jgi:hypothetical protein